MGTLLDGASIFVNNDAGSLKLENKGGNIVVRQSPVVSVNSDNTVVAKTSDGQNTIAAVKVVTKAGAGNTNVLIDESDKVLASVGNAVGLAVTTSDGADVISLNSAFGDSVASGNGSDIIRVNEGSNVAVDAGEGSDIIVVSGTGHTINGGSGNDILRINKDAGNGITVNGGTGNDIITVEAGSGHTLNGGVGNDKYVISKLEANGSYVIDQTSADAGDRDTLSLTSYSKDEFTYEVQNNGDLVMSHISGSVITVKGWEEHKLNVITFADGCLSKNDIFAPIEQVDTIVPENSTMEWSASAASNRLVLTGGNNYITVNNFNKDTVIDTGKLFEAGQDDWKFVRSGNDMVMNIYGHGYGESRITFKNYFTGSVYPKISDGNYEALIAVGTDNADVVDINSKFAVSELNDGNAVIYLAGAGDDTVTAGTGAYYITGDEGNDVFNITDAHDCHLEGGTGSDTFNINWNIGNRLEIDLQDYAANDIDTINVLNRSSSEFTFELDYNNIKLYDAEGGRLKLELENGLESSNFKGINFKDGESLSVEDIKNIIDVNVPTSAVTQQDVIKSFMKSLDNTTLVGFEAIDEAVSDYLGNDEYHIYGNSITIWDSDGHDSYTIDWNGLTDNNNSISNSSYYYNETEEGVLHYSQADVILNNVQADLLHFDGNGLVYTEDGRGIKISVWNKITVNDGDKTTIFKYDDIFSVSSSSSNIVGLSQISIDLIADAEISFTEASYAGNAEIGNSNDDDKDKLLKVAGNF